MTVSRKLCIALMTAGFASGAAAQGVDRYEFLEMQKKIEELNRDVAGLRGNAAGGRVNAIEDELRRLTDQIERLEHAVRQQESETKKKLFDLEYRIIELEGGDPSFLLEQQEGGSNQDGLAPGPAAPLPAPVAPAPSPQAPAPLQQQGAASPQGGTLGVMTTRGEVASDERALFDAGVAAANSGDLGAARSRLEGFLATYPGSPLAGEANFWLGEAYFSVGEYKSAAARYLDGATLNPAAPTAPESLLKLGISFGLLGRLEAACSTLSEVGARYPQAAEQVQRAGAEARRIGCG